MIFIELCKKTLDMEIERLSRIAVDSMEPEIALAQIRALQWAQGIGDAPSKQYVSGHTPDA